METFYEIAWFYFKYLNKLCYFLFNVNFFSLKIILSDVLKVLSLICLT